MSNQSVTAKDIPEVVEMWTDVFNFQKKYYNAPTDRESKESTEFWQHLIAESSQVIETHHSEICNDIVNAIIMDIGKRATEIQQLPSARI